MSIEAEITRLAAFADHRSLPRAWGDQLGVADLRSVPADFCVVEHSGLSPAGSSDCPVSPCAPLVGIYAAVTRKAENGQVLTPEEAVSQDEALKLYTLRGAHASFDERSKGSIEVGKLADMVVLSADPTAVEPEEIMDIRVEKTIIGGEVVWEA